jgi:DNA-binding response OmpR family regulator
MRILLVEDEVECAETLRVVLKREHFVPDYAEQAFAKTMLAQSPAALVFR